MMRIPVNPAIIRWAVQHGEKSEIDLSKKYPLANWGNPQSANDHTTFKQLQSFSQDTHIPFNYFFNQDVPQEENDFVKFRTIDNANVHPSRRLIDTIHAMESRQAWMRDYLLSQDETTRFKLTHQADVTMSPVNVAQNILDLLDLTDTIGASMTDDEFFNLLRTKMGNLGIMVMQNGIVGTNTHRPLDVTEFRAFVLIDDIVPLIFVNSADSRKAKIFSLIHEFVHVLLGNSEVLNVSPDVNIQDERWINHVTINVLMPSNAVKHALTTTKSPSETLKQLSNHFHTSLVATAIHLSTLFPKQYGQPAIKWARQTEQEALAHRRSKQSGGNFYNTALSRVDRRFANAIVNHEQSGQLSIPSAASMLGVSLKTYDKTVNHLLGLV